MSARLFRLSAFTATPEGGNPAGVWIGESLPHPAEMPRIAKEVGFSETAFLAPATGPERTVRYYSPEAEVSFCGHATIASGVILGETDGQSIRPRPAHSSTTSWRPSAGVERTSIRRSRPPPRLRGRMALLAVGRREPLDDLDYDFEPLKQIMLTEGPQLIWRESPSLFHAGRTSRAVIDSPDRCN